MARAARKLKSVSKTSRSKTSRFKTSRFKTSRSKTAGFRTSGFAEEIQPFAHDEIMRGVPAKRVQELIDRGALGEKAVYRVIPERTFKRRLANREALKVPEGDAIARFLRVTDAANKAFGEEDFARRWLNLPNPALNGRIPIELAETDAGAREVEDVLGRFAHGVYG